MKHLYDIYAGIKCLGDIRPCEDSVEPTVRRLVMICQSSVETPNVFTVYLLHPYPEMTTSADYRFEPSETGLPYPVFVETDLIGTVMRNQLRERVGGITKHLLKTLPWDDIRVKNGEAVEDERGNIAIDHREATRLPAGLPLLDRRDPRWKWKEAEYDDLCKLIAPFWSDFEW